MDQEGRGGFGEVRHHFAIEVVGNFVAVGVVPGSPQVRQGERDAHLVVQVGHLVWVQEVVDDFQELMAGKEDLVKIGGIILIPLTPL